jgi:hypothetical protein
MATSEPELTDEQILAFEQQIKDQEAQKVCSIAIQERMKA